VNLISGTVKKKEIVGKESRVIGAADAKSGVDDR
jgi:hypothetical protein